MLRWLRARRARLGIGFAALITWVGAYENYCSSLASFFVFAVLVLHRATHIRSGQCRVERFRMVFVDR